MLPTAHFIDEENKAQDMMSPTQDQDHTAEHLGPKAGGLPGLVLTTAQPASLLLIQQ